MSDIAIRCENLSKQYRIGRMERYKTLRDTLADTMFSPFRRLRSAFNGSGREKDEDNLIWALKDVSFDVNRGDVVGIIGRNGAGKSTLLKILSRITEPTAGYAQIYGRVGSLLEVGTGFHPELTGRENIYLNGAILGMKRAEIRRKFDEIVAFAEVEKFIDTPVKHFSSGMHVRLAFAVAAHLEPEILLVDEVLAVGDAQFQRKCLGKMRQVGEEGRTILFVSHNMAAVRQLCSRGILLESGKMLYQGGQDKTIARYMETVSSVNGGRERDYHHAKGDGRAYITKIRINETMNGEPIIPVFGEINMTVDYIVQSEINELEFFVLIYSLDGDVEVGLFQRDNSSYF
ncbi:MAG TPA: ABC transporter ATP-binding protein, partial [Nitrospiria bacterium]|nr:ABC transporter ATP-binding protein [Nitrospiria bacterium]